MKVLFILAGLGALGILAVRRLADQYTEPAIYDPSQPDTVGPIDPAPVDLAPPVDSAPAVNILGFQIPDLMTYRPPKAAAPYTETISKAERENAIPEGLLARLLYQESRYRQDIITGKVRSPVGAVGIAQFMPATAKDLGVDPLDPTSAINGAGRYLRQLYNQLGTWSQALAAYNWGIGNVKRKGMAKAPAETRAYVAQITADTGVN